MMRFFFILLTFLLLLNQSIAHASGASGSGYSGGGGYSNGSGNRQRVVDQNYEIGKSIYLGRKAGEPTLQYCILVDDEKKPVKRKSIKPFKAQTYEAVASNLYQCDKPDELIADGLTRDSFLYVLYYLNKRYKLDLKGQ